MNRTKFARLHMVICGVLPLVAIAALPAALPGKEPRPKCAATCAAPCVAEEIAIPVLSDIPYLGRLFKTVRYVAAPQGEPLAVDFAFEICPDCPQPGVACLPVAGRAPPATHQGMFQNRIVMPGMSPVPLPLACGPAGQYFPPAPVFQISEYSSPQNCAAGQCCQAAACCKAGQCSHECDENACCQAACQAAAHGGPSWERIVELTAKNAALEARLEAQEEFQEEKAELLEGFQDEKSDLLDSLVELSVEKGKLEAQVELHAKQAELTKHVLALVSENARLKAGAELAEQKLALLQQATHLALENQQLKQQLAAAKEQHAAPATFNEVQSSQRHPDARPSR